MGSGKTSLLRITHTPGVLYLSLVITVLLVSCSGAFGQALPDSFSVRDKGEAYLAALGRVAHRLRWVSILYFPKGLHNEGPVKCRDCVIMII